MAGLCSEVDHQDAVSLNYLLSLNDSMLISYASKYTPENLYDILEYRRRLHKILVQKIPGRLMTECIFHNWIWILIPIIIITMGSIGNLLSAVVLWRKSMSHISSYIYLATLAIVDEVILLCGLLRKWIEHVTEWSLENHSLKFCKLFQVIGVSSSIVSVWLIVTLTVERVLIIKRPFQASKYAKASRAKYIIILLMVISFSISCHFFETLTLFNENDSNTTSPANKSVYSGKCEFKSEYVNFSNLWFFIDGAFYSWMPLILLIITNFIILIEIYRARSIHNQMIHVNNDEDLKLGSSFVKTPNPRRQKEPTSRNRETKQLTVMLLIISFSFLLTTSPLVILKLLIRLKGNPDDTESQAKLVLLDAIFEMLMYVNHAINFYLYCATGNKFRQQLVAMLNCKKDFKSSNQFNNKLGKYNTTISKNLHFDETLKESHGLKSTSNR